MGLSRNKVAVPEGAAGTPPFWRGPYRRFLVLLEVCIEYIDEKDEAESKKTDKVELSPIAQLVRALH